MKEARSTADSKEALMEFVTMVVNTFDPPYPVDILITEHTGLLDCYAVFWIWMRHITEHLKEKWPMEYSKLDQALVLGGELIQTYWRLFNNENH